VYRKSDCDFPILHFSLQVNKLMRLHTPINKLIEIEDKSINPWNILACVELFVVCILVYLLTTNNFVERMLNMSTILMYPVKSLRFVF
jgi:hypothetical protein